MDLNGSAAIKLIECPRDAMQGWRNFIPTEKKIAYINELLKVGFDTIDFGSFVSSKAIPQMADTHDVLASLQLQNSHTKLLAIVANARGADEAVEYDEISYVGFPFSISLSFQLRNTNSTIEESLIRVGEIQNLCLKHKKQLVIYLSMAFGNPYGDTYNEDILLLWAEEMVKREVRIISLSDTVGVASPEQISFAVHTLVPKHPHIEFGVHLHSTTNNWQQKLEAAHNAGCRRFDGAIKGIGGCPMANDTLVGNMNTEWMIDHFSKAGYPLHLNTEALANSLKLADEIFV
jgi:hydroxymethylglutaryl-CoA lyase